MQKLITSSGKNISIFHIIRHQTTPSLEVKILESSLTIGQDALMAILRTPYELSRLTLKTEDDVFMNQYQNYSKMDTYSVKHNYVVKHAVDTVPATEEMLDEEGNVIQEATPAIPAVPEVVDNLITIFLLQRSEMENQIENNTLLVDAMSIAIAEILGV